ncbi:MAG: class I SAM-dependent methyltransferase, partial [Anaerolineae bacterium]
VLEVGSGDGLTSYLLARQGNSVLSIDVSTIAIEQARARLGHEALDLRYEYGDARNLPFPDACFDYVVSEHLVEHLSAEDFIKHLTEVHRVLNPGGCYLFFTPSRLWHGRRSVGFHLQVYILAEICPVIRRQGFAVTWLEPRFLPRWGFVLQLPLSLLGPLFLYERILEAGKVHRWPEPIQARIIPSLMVRARKP